MQFTVRTYDGESRSVLEKVVEADSSEAATDLAKSATTIVLAVAPKRTQSTKPQFELRPRPLDMAWWCRELKALLTAGMTVVEAIETLNHESVGRVLGRARSQIHGQLIVKLREGKLLSSAMQEVGGFPDILVAGVRASERTGSLREGLGDYIEYHQMVDRLRQQVVSAAIYPSLVLALGGLVTLFLLVFVIPRFSGMYADLRGELSWTTHVLIAVSNLLNRQIVPTLVVIGAMFASIGFSYYQGWLLNVVLRGAGAISPLQRKFDEFRLAKLYHSLALMFRGGYALDESLRQCRGLGLGVRISSAVDAADHRLAQGQRVSKAFGESGLTDVVTLRLLAVGERTGNFDKILQAIAERHASNFALFVERATRIVEPLLLLTVALVVGAIVVMMYMPIFDIASSIN